MVLSVEKRFMLPLIFSSLLVHSLWIKYSAQGNVSVIFNEATREYIAIVQINFSRKIVPARNYLRIILVPCNNILVLEEVVSLHFLCNIWQASNFFRISFVSHGIVLAKLMAKQGEVLFFLSNKKFEWPCYIEN